MEILWWIGITGMNKVNERYIDGVIWFIDFYYSTFNT